MMVARYFIVITLLYYLVKLVDVSIWNIIRERRFKHLISPEATHHVDDVVMSQAE